MAGNHKENGTDRTVLVRRKLALYDHETFLLLNSACQFAEHKEEEQRRLHNRNVGNNTVPVLPKKKNVDEIGVDFDDGNNSNSGSSTIGNNEDSESLGSSNESDNENNNDNSDSDEGNDSETVDDTTTASTTTTPEDHLSLTKLNLGSVKNKKPTPKPSGKLQKRLIQDINKHSDNLIRVEFPLPSNDDDCNAKSENEKNEHLHLFPAAALLPKNALREPISVAHQAKIVTTLSEQLSSSVENDAALIVVLLIQSGRFAGGVFRRGRCLAHRATARYTIRKGQGKAQSAQDGSKRPKSVGSQLRRAGEEQLKIDIRSTLKNWTEMGYFKKACLIFLSCPKTMQSDVYSPSIANAKTNGKTTKTNEFSDGMLSKTDDRIRKIPFDVGRATFHNVEVVYKVLTGVDLCHVQNLGASNCDENETNNSNRSGVSVTKTEKDKQAVEEHDPEDEKRRRREELTRDLPMTPLHVASRDGKLEVLMDLLNQNRSSSHTSVDGGVAGDSLDVDRPAGYNCMTPLHFAAASSADPTIASALVSALLVEARADPTSRDAKGRPPYFLAGHDRVREAFRKARAVLGEDYCDWEKGARVGPPLTQDDLEAKKEREAEKKRRKKARQKENKARARAEAQEAEERKQAEEAAQQASAEAKRVRDGLSAKKPISANACDFCGKICRGRNAAKNMFRRLDYKYCSIECVNKHKRELMAAAAMARFGC